jgi:acetolactate decarboxylase
MRKRFLNFTIFIIFICLPLQAQSGNALTQFGVLDALLKGGYDGFIQTKKILDHGSFGLGTFDKLHGEMIVYNGNIYQAKYDGTVEKENLPNTIPFAAVVNFNIDVSFRANNIDSYESLKKFLTGKIEKRNLPVAVKVKGTFDRVKVRSVPAQEKPYKPLTEVVKNQSEFEYTDLEGVLVGFLLPSYFKPMNAAGFHFHFLSKDESKGGHLLEVDVNSAEIELDVITDFKVNLPEDNETFDELNLGNHKTEKSYE